MFIHNRSAHLRINQESPNKDFNLLSKILEFLNKILESHNNYHLKLVTYRLKALNLVAELQKEVKLLINPALKVIKQENIDLVNFYIYEVC